MHTVTLAPVAALLGEEALGSQPTPPRSPRIAATQPTDDIDSEKRVLCHDASELDTILERMRQLTVQFVDAGKNTRTPVVVAMPPSELQTRMDFVLPKHGLGLEGIWPLVEKTLKYSVNSWNPRFMDKLYASTDAIGVLSELLLAVLNANTHVYHVSPVVTSMEVEVCQQLGALIGFGKTAGGLVCPGGSASNLLSAVTARNVRFPEIKKQGNQAGHVLTMFTSAHGHYSVDKAAMVLGIGTDHVIKVPCDAQGSMLPEELEKCVQASIARNEKPFYINATAGTTVLAAFDPLRAIGDIAKRYNLWLHVDGSYGGSVVFSTQHRRAIDGIELADSFTINPHKMLGVPLQCSLLLLRSQETLCTANATSAGYLFHGNRYDLGDGGIGCGRRGDALKMFMAWKYHGIEGFGARIERSYQLTAYFTSLLNKHDRFQLVCDNGSFNVCFWYVPAWMVPGLEHHDQLAWQRQLGAVTRLIHASVNQSGDFQVDYAPLPAKPHFFRIPMHASIRETDIDALVALISHYGQALDERAVAEHM